jgi:hypothetical protein
MVVLTTDDTSTISSHPREGLLVVYQQQQQQQERENIHSRKHQDVLIRLGTAVSSYKGIIPFAKVKLPEDQKANIPQYLLQDGSQHESIVVSFQFDNKNTPAHLKLIIQQRIKNWGTLKFVFQDVLLQQQQQQQYSLLSFCATLGDVINDGQAKLTRLSEELASVQQNLNSWKTTAQALETKGREEKHKLLQNTLLAWQENQQTHKERIADLTKQLSHAQQKFQNRSNKRALDAPDDLDAIIIKEEPLAESTVQALAAGRRVNHITRTPILDPLETFHKADMERDRIEYEQKKRSKGTKKSPPPKKKEEQDPSSSPPPKPAKRQRKSKQQESPDSSAIIDDGIDNNNNKSDGYNSEEERMRMAIRTMVQNSRLDDDSDTDLST